jgi:hypothetical protein
VTASFSCPTVTRNEGLTLPERAKELRRLADAWQCAFPAPDRQTFLDGRRPLDVAALGRLREILGRILERRIADEPPDLRVNVGRMAWFLDDLCRRQVAGLGQDRFGEYLATMGQHAAGGNALIREERPSPLTYLLARGFLFAAVSARSRRERASVSWLVRRARSVRLLAHIHGLAPAPASFRVARARRPRWPEAGHAVWAHALRFLRSGVSTLGTGRWPVVTEVGVTVATLNAAFALAGMRAQDGRIEEDAFLASLSEAADLLTMGRGVGVQALGMLGGGVGALRVLASGRLA